MIIKKNKNGKYKVISRKWYEWFYILVNPVFIAEGEILPRFYVPIKMNKEAYYVECWAMPLAPFVAVWVVWVRLYFRGMWALFNWTNKQFWQRKEGCDTKGC